MPNLNLAEIILLIVVLGLLAWNLFLQWQYLILKKRLRAIFNGRGGRDLEGVLAEATKRIRQNQKDIQAVRKFSLELERMARASVQKVSVVRFNPFAETGGNQSFVLCLLDDRHTGAIISSLFVSSGNRLFAKPIKEGKSEFPLTREEAKALREAIKK